MSEPCYSVEDLNPKGKAVKTNEMTVRRALQIIELWDEHIVRDSFHGWPNWDDIPNLGKYNDILGDKAYSLTGLLNELFARYRDKSLHRQVVDLFETLPTDLKERYQDDIDAVREKLDR